MMVNGGNPELVVSLDLSSRGMGAAGLYAGRLFVFELASSSPKVTSFQEVRSLMVELTQKLKMTIGMSLLTTVPAGVDVQWAAFSRVSKLDPEKSKLVFEMPPPRGQMAPLLWGLDCHLVNELMESGFAATGCSCLLCKSILGGKKATKSDALKLVNSDPIFNDCLKLNAEWKKVESHNIAEAMIILMTYSYLGCELAWGLGVFPGFAPYVLGKSYKWVSMNG